jgi:methionine-rich copper-binding protein CopC
MPSRRSVDKIPRTANPFRQACRLLTVLLAASAAAAPASAWGHAVVVTASPEAGARIAPGKVSIRLRMSSRIDLERSRLALQAPGGAEYPVALVGGGKGGP